MNLIVTLLWGHSLALHLSLTLELLTSQELLSLLPLDKNSSALSLYLSPGQYRVHVYDIEQDGILNNGQSYPAAVQELELPHNGFSQGKTINEKMMALTGVYSPQL